MHSWEGDPHQLATPDFGKAGQKDRSIDPDAGGWRILLAVVAGILLAVPFAASAGRGVLAQMAQWLTPHQASTRSGNPVVSPVETGEIDHLGMQQQAELLLGSAVRHETGATDQIMARVEAWRGNLQLTQKLNSELTAAFDSEDLQVRAAAVELDLAALGLAKTPRTMDQLARKATAGPQPQRIWAEWEMALLGSRGVEKEQVTHMLIGQTRDPNPDVRRWAVAGLAYLGTDEAISPLLKAFHDDSALKVREEAARGLAQSGMFTKEQRRAAVPKLLDDAADASLDTQTRDWAFHALRDITGQHLPNDAAAWKDWYTTNHS